MGAQGAVIDAEGRILLVRHGYRDGSHFPGGGVEWGETVLQSLLRELDEETGVEPTGVPPLFGLYANFTSFPGDHIALFAVRQWRRREWSPNREIVEAGFYERDSLPEDTTPGTRARLAEIFDGTPASDVW